MCIICVSEKGVKQPDKATLRRMFEANPDGAGFMFCKGGRVHISKGYMNFPEFWQAVRSAGFTENDVTVYHFRISTQAGVQPSMTQPFPLTNELKNTKALDCITDLGIAHNGIIRAYSDPTDREYSDTAHFVAEALSGLVQSPKDLNKDFLEAVSDFAGGSRFCFLDKAGRIFRAGRWIEDGGLWYSNYSYLPLRRAM